MLVDFILWFVVVGFFGVIIGFDWEIRVKEVGFWIYFFVLFGSVLIMIVF